MQNNLYKLLNAYFSLLNLKTKFFYFIYNISCPKYTRVFFSPNTPLLDYVPELLSKEESLFMLKRRSYKCVVNARAERCGSAIGPVA